MSIGDRLKELRGEESQSAFGDRFNKGRNTIVRYETDKNPPDADFIEAVCLRYKISPTWLLLGKGNKYLISNDNNTNSSLLDKEQKKYQYQSEGIKKQTAGEIQEGLLNEIIQAVEEYLIEIDGVLPPDKKAKLITLLYQLLIQKDTESKDIKKSTIVNLVRLAV